MLKALIIDDEQPARNLIKHHIGERQDVEALGECSNGFEALKLIRELKPDLLFLDIRMPKITGFELLELLEERPIVIFSTAYDEFAIKAFELNAVDYLLKPYSGKRFHEAVDKALAKYSSNSAQNASAYIVGNTLKTTDYQRIVVRNGNQIEILPFNSVHYIEASNDYIDIHTEKSHFLKQATMKEMEGILPTAEFLRVHRSYIVKVDLIQKIEPYSKDSHLAILKNGQKIPVSRSGYKKLRSLLNI